MNKLIKFISRVEEEKLGFSYFLNYLQKILGCNILSAILEEYATTVKSSELNLTWEVHLREKKQFELSDMKKIFKLCIEILGQFTENDFDELTLPFLKHLLSIVESMLVWSFVNANYILLLLIYFEFFIEIYYKSNRNNSSYHLCILYSIYNLHFTLNVM